MASRTSVAAVMVAFITAISISLPSCASESDPPNATASPSSTITRDGESVREKRERQDYESAERAYRSITGEVDRLAAAGGASEPTALMRATATGAYLEFQMESLRIAKKKGWRTTGPTNIVGIARRGWSSTSISLSSCEDNSKIRVLNRYNRDVTPKSSRRYIQNLTIKRVDKSWKVATATTQVVPDFQNRDCGQ